MLFSSGKCRIKWYEEEERSIRCHGFIFSTEIVLARCTFLVCSVDEGGFLGLFANVFCSSHFAVACSSWYPLSILFLTFRYLKANRRLFWVIDFYRRWPVLGELLDSRSVEPNEEEAHVNLLQIGTIFLDDIFLIQFELPWLIICFHDSFDGQHKFLNFWPDLMQIKEWEKQPW